MEMTIEEIRQVIYKADVALRPLIVFVSPSYAKALKKALPKIEEKVVIQETEFVENGKAVVVERKKLEAWTYGNVI